MGYGWLVVVLAVVVIAAVPGREDKNKMNKLAGRVTDLENELNDLKKLVTGGRKINPHYDPKWSSNRNDDGTEKNSGDVEWDSEKKSWRKFVEDE